MPYISLNGQHLHYSEAGEFVRLPALLFLHGAGGCAADWPYQWQQRGIPPSRGNQPARITDYRRYFLDLPGHGRSHPPARQSIAAYAEDVAAFAQAAAPGPTVLVGHSMGGAIAQAVGLMNPAWLAGLVLLGSGPAMPVSDLILDGLRENFAETVGLIMKFSWQRDARPLYREVATQHMLGAGREVVYGDFAACNGFDITERVVEIRVPVLVVGSTSDRMMPLAQSQKLAAAIPNSRLAVIEDGGHFMMTERTGLVTEALVGFVQGLPTVTQRH